MKTYEDEPALLWRDARVLINEDGYLVGAVVVTGTGLYRAYDLVNVGAQTYESEQDAIRSVEEAFAE